MPTKKERELVAKMKREGKTPSQQAGEFVRMEIEQIRHKEHGAANTKQAIAIGLSEARRAGVDLPPPKKGKYDEETREQAKRELKVGDDPNYKVSRKRSMAARKALKKEPTVAASPTATRKRNAGKKSE